MSYTSDCRSRCEACKKDGKRCSKLGSWDAELNAFICLWHWKSKNEHGQKLELVGRITMERQ